MKEFQATITDLSHDGKGVARIDGKAVFVSGALLGEDVLLRIRKRHRHFDEAEVVELLKPSRRTASSRAAAISANAVAVRCSTWMPTSQIEAKQRVLTDNFERIGKVSPALWLPPLTDEAWGYRRKGRLSVRQRGQEGPRAGRFSRGEQPALRCRYPAMRSGASGARAEDRPAGRSGRQHGCGHRNSADRIRRRRRHRGAGVPPHVSR